MLLPCLFAPLKQRGINVIHADLKQDSGVDFVGDILDPEMRKQLCSLNVKSILCSNMLEHVCDIPEMCSAIEQICPRQGILGISVPFHYPYHPDPLDNYFRPNLLELKNLLLPYGFQSICGEIINFGNYGTSLRKHPQLLIRDIYLCIAGILNEEKRRVLLGNYRFLLKQYQVTCAIFRRV